MSVWFEDDVEKCVVARVHAFGMMSCIGILPLTNSHRLDKLYGSWHSPKDVHG